MSEGRHFKAWINPLLFFEADEAWAAQQQSLPTVESVLRFACTPEISADLQSFITRYREISSENSQLFAAPAEERILEKLVWPLRHAKASYMFGNYLGTISLCGMVAEMVAILLFDISEFKINNNPMSQSDQVAIFGSSFEKLGQERRVVILHAYGIIDDDIKKSFDLIRTKRRQYLQLWSQDHTRLPSDAQALYRAAVSIVVRAIGQNVHQGMISLNPSLMRYLERQGVYEPQEDNTD
jgi:hypothetical protein